MTLLSFELRELVWLGSIIQLRQQPTGTIFGRYTITNRRFVQLIGAALALTFLVTELQPLQRIFATVSLTSSQWGICLLGPIVFVAAAELGKLAGRRRSKDVMIRVTAPD